MKSKFTWAGIIASLLVVVTTFFVACKKDDMNEVVKYHGQVVYINTTTPFADVTVKVTDGKNTHCQTLTDGAGLFSLKVRVNEIDGNYFLLAGDSTCIPKKVALGGYGQAEVDLGTIEVEGPALPTVVTKTIQSVTADAAVIGGEVQTDGRLSVTARGICYGTETYPTVDGLRTTDGTGIGEFTSNLKNLQHNTIYYARAYATNRMGTAYGEQVKFTTEEGVAIVVTDSIIRITAHSARCKGHVESDGGYPVTKRGTCWSKQPDPTIDDFCTNDGSGLGEFTSSMNDLIENTTYYVRTYATNSTSTTYGEQFIITTLDGLAVVTTDSITLITATGFSAYGTVVSDCDIPVTARGFCYATTQFPTIENTHTTSGKGLGKYQSNIVGLDVNTTYYVRAYATNATATIYGEQIEVTTLNGLPVIQTKQISCTATSITVIGEVIETGGFEVTERGVCYSTLSVPSITDSKLSSGKGKGAYSLTITDLSASTTYYVRTYAINENGESYGQTDTITTQNGMAEVELGTISNITALTALGSVSVKKLNGATLQSCGLCWATLPYPTITDSITIADGIQLNTPYPCNMPELQPNTTYYVRAYATTDATTSYSEQSVFTTAIGLPVLSTTATIASSTNISSGGNITSDGGYSITTRGLCYSTTNSTPTLADQYTVSGMGTGEFSSIITNVSENMPYYVCAYATNEIGTAYGDVVAITTCDVMPSVTTTVIGENVTSTTATGGGNVTDEGGFGVTARGVCWSTLPNPTISDNKTIDGTGAGYFTSYLTNIDLTGNNLYYVRAYATGANGRTAYGNTVKVSKQNIEYASLPVIRRGEYYYKIHPDLGAPQDWYSAKAACENLEYGGYDDWMLPDRVAMFYIMQSCTSGWIKNDGTEFDINYIPNTSLPSEEVYGPNYWTSYSFDRNGSLHVATHRWEYSATYGWQPSVEIYWLWSNLGRVRPVRKYLANQ